MANTQFLIPLYILGTSKEHALDELLVEKDKLLRMLKRKLFDTLNRMKQKSEKEENRVGISSWRMGLGQDPSLLTEISGKTGVLQAFTLLFGLYEVLERMGQVAE